jgi:hypothetical protein
MPHAHHLCIAEAPVRVLLERLHHSAEHVLHGRTLQQQTFTPDMQMASRSNSIGHDATAQRSMATQRSMARYGTTTT